MKNLLDGKEVKPYFRFSHKVRDPEDLLSWFDWFKKCGIPCCITRTPFGKRYPEFRYAIWRAGRDATKCSDKANREAIEGEIIMSFDPVGVFGKEVSGESPTTCSKNEQKLKRKGGE